MDKIDIESFFNDDSKREQVNQPNEENLSQETTESSNDDLELTSNSENQGENQNQGEKDQEKAETPTVEKKKDWSQQNEFKGYLDEKEKRQKLEKELEEFKAKFEQVKMNSKSEKVKKPDALDDPEAAIKYSQDQLEQQIWSQKVGLSESILKSMGDKFSDYDEKRSLFMDLAKDDPSLAQKLRNSDNPALFAYETATNHLKVKEFSNPDYEKNLREQIKKEILDEMSKGQQTSNNSNSSLPVVKGTSLTNTTGSKNINSNSSGNSLDEIFKDHHLG